MRLAINGGNPVRNLNNLFPRQLCLGKEEKEAVNRVLDSGTLSGFRGSYNEHFLGATEVRSFEEEFAKKVGATYAISCNSCTSALWIACHAVKLSPGDEYITTPWSMVCSATMGLTTGAIPIFADLEEDYFIISPDSIKKRITNKTKAIIVVDLFGQIHSHQFIKKIAQSYNIPIIVDAAQAPFASYTWADETKQYAGTFGDLTCFSFTSGKIFHCGEGGMITTNNHDLARRCQLLRNHAESVLADMSNDDVRNRFADGMNHNMIGQNLRLCEINAAIMREQIKKADYFIKLRQNNVEYFNKHIPEVAPCLSPTPVRSGNEHVYYVHPLKYDSTKCDGIHRNKFIEAVKAELAPEEGRPDKALLGSSYIRPLQTFPIFRRKKLYGNDEFPFEMNLDTYKRIQENYTLESTPICTDLWRNTFVVNMFQGLPLADKDREDVVNAFEKCYKYRKELL